jgi:hypothetical protein
MKLWSKCEQKSWLRWPSPQLTFENLSYISEDEAARMLLFVVNPEAVV